MPRSKPADPAPIAMLKQDHRDVARLFAEWEQADDESSTVRLVSHICQALTVHAQVEEHLFYPRVMAAADDDRREKVFQAAVEHGALTGLIAQLVGARPGDTAFRAYVSVLQQYVQLHVREEEDQLFPQAAGLDLDFAALAQEMQDLKDWLEDQIAQQDDAIDGAVTVVTIAPVGADPAALAPASHNHAA